MRKIMPSIAILMLLLVMTAVAQRNQPSPPASDESIDLIQTSIAKRMGTTGEAHVGWDKSGKVTVHVEVDDGHANALYGMWLVGPKGMLKLGDTKRTDQDGDVELMWSGKLEPSNFKDFAVYYLPKESSAPRKGAIRMLSIPVEQARRAVTGGTSGGQPAKKPSAKQAR